MKPFSVCIVSHNGYGAITGGRSGYIGGIEWQTSVLARWLAARGHRVSFITWHEGGPDEEMLDGVRVMKVCRRNEGWRGLRFFHPRWTGLVKMLKRADADVYYHNGGEVVTGQVGLWCRRHGRAFVFSVASDGDCHHHPPYFARRWESAFYRAGLRRADRLVAQTRTQAERLKELFHRDATVIPMPCADTSATSNVSKKEGGRLRVLWVGRVCPVKRAELLLQVARACPGMSFDLVGPYDGEDYGRNIAREAKMLPNVQLHGLVPRSEVGRHFAQADVLCCTSEYEGFPNTFLEAWNHGLPVVSTFDPDGVMGREGLGLFVRDAVAAAEGLRKMADDPALRLAMGQRAKDYYERTHTLDQTMPQFERVLAEAVEARRGRRANA